MKYRKTAFIAALALASATAFAADYNRNTTTLNEGWLFAKDGESWQQVRVPHDWAIYGPFDRSNDLQTVAVEQNGEKEETVKTGRTGGLPFIGKGRYKIDFELADTAGRATAIVFDGAMSNAKVTLNGTYIGEWPYGYNSFVLDATGVAVPGKNLLEVELENKERASRWYPGAGLYRNVHVVSTSKVHIPVWGTYVTTPKVTDDYASVRLQMKIDGAPKDSWVTVETDILDPAGDVVASDKSTYVSRGQSFAQNFLVERPERWTLDSPALYTARTRLSVDGREVDSYDTRFGIRTIEYIPEKGFFLNGEPVKFRGVCNHHDLGPLGAAVNRSALRHQLELLKDMGANAVRTSHNMPAPELVELCDEMGVMLMVEPFDDWGFRPKSPNGYGSVFDSWAERDITNMVEHYRNSPSVVMWSIGNEVPSQWGPDGMRELLMLQDLVHSLDPTRPVTCGMDQIDAVLSNGFAAALDIPGFNYKPQHYDRAYAALPQKLILGSETASTVSSRGKYYFPVEFEDHQVVMHPDNHSNSYDNESCSWSNTPDLDFEMDDDRPWVIGQFVWTGFDYLGEPTPFGWPARSSYFGIVDLAGFPKDVYYMYQSRWRPEKTVLHLFPHWNWQEGSEVDLWAYYNNADEVELFVNGKSQGVRRPDSASYHASWRVTYTPGKVEAVSRKNGKEVARTEIRTASEPYRVRLTADRTVISPDGKDLCYLTAEIVDKDGNLCPTADNEIVFEVKGAGKNVGVDNGSPISLERFKSDKRRAFNGKALLIVQSNGEKGKINILAKSANLKSANETINAKL